MAVFISPGGIFHGNLSERRALRTSRESFLIIPYRKVALSGDQGLIIGKCGVFYTFPKIHLFFTDYIR